jgi:cytidine deaminase
MDYAKLARFAKAAKKHSYSPYSHFRVGAAVLSRGGRVYTGCNVENSSYGLTVCAERTALFKAISEGERDFVAIAIASDENTYTPPCGACRQVIMDLAGDIDVVLTRRGNSLEVHQVSQLLPLPFGIGNLKSPKKLKR